jgi:hypothetical protein
MKKIILGIVFICTVSFAFAANKMEKVSTFDIEETLEVINSLELVNIDFTSISLNSTFELTNSFDLIRIKSAILSDCSGITVTLGDGDSFVWSGSCEGLWKLVKAYLEME